MDTGGNIDTAVTIGHIIQKVMNASICLHTCVTVADALMEPALHYVYDAINGMGVATTPDRAHPECHCF